MMDDRSYSWHDDFLNVAEDTVPVLWLCRRSFRDKILHVSRLHVRNHPPLPDGEQVLGDVVHQLFTCIRNRRCHSRRHSTPVNHVKNRVHDYLCDCILQPAFCLDESSFWWFTVCSRWLKGVQRERSPNYIKSLDKNTP